MRTKVFGLFLPRAWVHGAVTALVLGLIAATIPLGPEGLIASGVVAVAALGMILDELLEFADAVSVAVGASTILVGDVIPLTVARDLGAGKPVYLVISVDTEIITGGSAGTIQFLLVSDAQAAIATDGSASVHFTSKAFVTDDSAANDTQMNAGQYPVIVALPMEGVVYEAFLGVLAVVATTTITAGKVNAFLTTDVSKWKAYSDQF